MVSVASPGRQRPGESTKLLTGIIYNEYIPTFMVQVFALSNSYVAGQEIPFFYGTSRFSPH
jgi:hypothetical protein